MLGEWGHPRGHFLTGSDVQEQSCVKSRTYFLLLFKFSTGKGGFHCCTTHLLALFQNGSYAI